MLELIKDSFGSRLFWIGFASGATIAATLLYKNSKGDTILNKLTCTRSTAALISELDEEFKVSSNKLSNIVKSFMLQMQHGLEEDNQTLQMIPSFVSQLPTGQEIGTYLAVDLGGTNFRVCEVVLQGKGKYKMRHKKFVISDQTKKGTGEGLFNFLAESVQGFLKDMDIHATKDSPLAMGFTFSFPVDQKSINSGTLIQWNKGFNCSEVVGKDVVKLFQDALRKKIHDKGVPVKITALVNDTVGTLVAHSYLDPQCYIGVILGTGTNAAYLEAVSNIPKFQSENEDCMIINTEWGAFDNEQIVLPITKYDRQLDRDSIFPVLATMSNFRLQGNQIFEKMISGMYLGEIARLIILDFIEQGGLFGGKTPQALLEKDSFHTAYLSRAERDHSVDLIDVASILQDSLKIKSTTLQERKIVKFICEKVGIRAARLSAAAVGAVVAKSEHLAGCTVAIDGSLFEHYPNFSARMFSTLQEIYGISAENIKLSLARDGSGKELTVSEINDIGVGAALIACLATK